MKTAWKPILFLMVAAPIATEVFTTNLLPSQFFTPWMFLFMVTLGYGIPVLLVREVAVRKNFGLLGILFLGIIYGIYNEGLIAKTFFEPYHSPMKELAAYGLAGDLRVPWALVISLWHALFAVLVPIALTYLVFPAHRANVWLGKRTAWILTAVCLAAGTLLYFSGNEISPKGKPEYYLFMIVAGFALWVAAKRQKSPPDLTLEPFRPVLKYLGWGVLLFLALLMAPPIFANNRLHPGVYLVYLFGLVYFIWRVLSRMEHVSAGQILAVGIGEVAVFSLFYLLISLQQGGGERSATLIINLAVLFFLYKYIKRKSYV